MREENIVKETMRSLGADICGIANIERFADCPSGFSPTDIFGECKSVVAFGVALPKGAMRVAPRIVYGHFNNIGLSAADEIAFQGARMIERALGCACVPVPSDSPYEYWDADALRGKGILSMRHAAALAGLGTLGKSTLLINRQYGSLLTLGAILADLNLSSDELCEPQCIEGCRRCIGSCPVSAIKENGTVEQKLCRGRAYGKTKRGFDTVECNACRAACPLSR